MPATLYAISPALSSLLNSSRIGQRSPKLLIPEDAIFALYISTFIGKLVLRLKSGHDNDVVIGAGDRVSNGYCCLA
jgi:hypothetical protein